MIKFSSKTSILIGVGILAVALLLALWQPWQARDLEQAGLVDVHDITTLQTRFNADSGQARLVLIVAPT